MELLLFFFALKNVFFLKDKVASFIDPFSVQRHTDVLYIFKLSAYVEFTVNVDVNLSVYLSALLLAFEVTYSI